MAHRILSCLGGYRVVADQLGVPPRRVRQWYLDGIPPKYHLDLLCLVPPYPAGMIVTIDNIESTCMDGVRYRSIHRRHPAKRGL
jgi:hypothetical protein